MIDPTLMKYLSPDQAEHMRAFEQMFSSKGWELLKKLLEQQQVSASHRVMTASSWPDNRIAFGQLDTLTALLRIEDTFAAEFQQEAEAAQSAQKEQELADELEYE